MVIPTFHCTECGQPIRGSAGLGLCSACVLRGAMGLDEPAAAEGPAANNAFRRFGDYDLLEELARGGMGVVYRARQRSLGREVALKVLLGGAFAGEDGKRRLQAEAAAAAQLRHPNIVTVHDAGLVDGQPFFSMSLVPGPTLEELVRSGPIPAQRAARYVVCIAEAVHYAHTQGVLHRDLKPSNVLLDARDEPHVTDFGLAKSFQAGGAAANESPDLRPAPARPALTLSGQVLGSPAYMPPEQATGRGRELGPASDVYSIGAILYELLTARPPFVGDTAHEVIEQLKTLEPIPVRRLESCIPPDLETVCLKCLEKEPHRRYSSARELADDLTRFLEGEPVRARPVGPAGRLFRVARRRPWRTTTVLLAAALIVIAGGALAWKARTERLHSVALRKEQAATRLAMMQSQLGEARALIRSRQADSRPQAEAILAQLLEQQPPPALREEARDLALAALALPSARAEPLLGEGALSDDWTLAVGDLPRERWALATFRGRVAVRPLRAATNLLEFSTAPRVVTALIAFSPGGRWLAMRHRDELGVWDTAAGSTQRLAVIRKAWANGNAFGFCQTAFAPDDAAVLWSDGSTVVTTALPDGRNLARWSGANGQVLKIESLAFAPEGGHVALALADAPVIETRSWPQGRVEQTFNQRSTQGISALAFSPKADRMAAGNSAGRVTVFRSDGGPDPVLEFNGHAEGIRALRFAGDGRHLVTTSADETLRLWDGVTGAEITMLPFEGAGVTFSSDGLNLGVGSAGGKLSLAHFEPSPILRRFPAGPPSANPQTLSFHPDGRSLFCLTEGGAMRCSVPDGAPLTFFPSRGARSVLAEPDDHGGLIITGATGVKRHSLTDPTAETTIMTGTGYGWGGPALSANGRWIAACYKSHGQTAVWPAGDRDGSRAKILIGGSGEGEAALSPDGSQVAVNSHYSADIIVFNVAQGTPFQTLPLPPRHAIAWSPDGQWLAGIGNTFHLWDAKSWERKALPVLDPNVASFTAVAFSSPEATGRSRYLAITTGSTRIALVEVATRAVVARLEAPQARSIYRMAFSADGHWLAVAVAGGEIQLWDIPTVQSRCDGERFGLGPAQPPPGL